jgi:hypothetical protein
MFLSSRAASIRNLSVAGVNGVITLIILLIAPLGLAAVIMNTALVTIATLVTATAADRIVWFLQGEQRFNELSSRDRSRSIRRSDPGSLDRR